MTKRIKENVQQSFNFDEDKKVVNKSKSDYAIIGVIILIVGLIVTTLCLSNKGTGRKNDVSLYHADIVVKDYGTIKVELDGTVAPITVQNFVDLANSKFYDGLTFHRIMEGFMIQGGDPSHNGNGGSSQNIKGEFSANGVKNDISHVRGTISMARRSDDMNSASSQFFIVQEDSTFLDGNYAAFGHVTDGMDIVDKIAKDAKPTDNNGTIKYEEQPVIEKITIYQ